MFSYLSPLSSSTYQLEYPVTQMALKRPNAISFSKKNAVRPFEDASSLEFWAQKNDASLFVVGQSTKKRPHGLTFVRMFDHRVLDMCEVGIEGWKSMADFKVGRCQCVFTVYGRAGERLHFVLNFARALALPQIMCTASYLALLSLAESILELEC